MARNSVQFQKGLGEAEFHDLYGSEEQCQEAVFAWRWPQGFVCPDCGGRDHSVVKTRALYQCASCRRQTSLTAGTIFAASKLPLRTWFRAMDHLTQGKGGISSLELARRLGVTQTTAWKLKRKLMQVVMERDAGKRLTGRVEMDDADLGGERSGGKRGRGSPGKTPIVAAVETTPEGQPVRLKLRRVAGGLPAQGGRDAGAPRHRAGEHRRHRRPRLLPGRRRRGRAAPTSRSGPGRAARRRGHPPSTGSTRPWATSSPRSPAPTGPSGRSTSRATSPRSNTASTDAATSPP
jgi:transposase-like protein